MKTKDKIQANDLACRKKLKKILKSNNPDNEIIAECIRVISDTEAMNDKLIEEYNNQFVRAAGMVSQCAYTLIP